MVIEVELCAGCSQLVDLKGAHRRVLSIDQKPIAYTHDNDDCFALLSAELAIRDGDAGGCGCGRDCVCDTK